MRTRRKKVMSEMNVVPYIDVMLVLLVIFMVTAPMLQTGVDVNLPDAEANPLQSSNDHQPLILSIGPDGQYFLDDEESLELEQLTTYVQAQLAGEMVNRPVYIRADESVANGFVVKAMAAIQQAGAKNIGLMANSAENPTVNQ
ncbi:MAG: protein TolR [bacterium]